MTKKSQRRTTSWKFGDLMYGALGVAAGFFVAFTITNTIQRDTASGQASPGATAQQTGQLPPDHPPIDGGSSGEPVAARGAPPPLPSLEPRDGPGPTAEDVFQDIQVLKGLPPTDVQQIMGIITVSLGLKDCNYCHVPGSFESPHPKKEIARTMLRMVRQINQDFVGGKVNCYTCHRGAIRPVTQ